MTQPKNDSVWSVLVTIDADLPADTRTAIFDAVCAAVMPFDEQVDGDIDVSGQPLGDIIAAAHTAVSVLTSGAFSRRFGHRVACPFGRQADALPWR